MKHNDAREFAMPDEERVSTARRKFLIGSGVVTTGVIAGLAGGFHNYHWEEPSAYQAWTQIEKGALTDLEYIVQCGTLAANAHNTQPWSFSIQGLRIALFADLNRNIGRADPRRRLMLMSIGCAAENMVVAAGQLGYAVRIDDAGSATFPVDGGRCVVLELSRSSDSGRHPWFPALFQRRTTRAPFAPLPMPYRDFAAQLGNLSDLPGVQLRWYESDLERAAIIKAVNVSVRGFVEDEGAYHDGMAWFRRSRSEWEQRRDGISIFGGDAPLLVKEWVDLFASEDDLLSPAFRQGEVDVAQRLAETTPLWVMVRADVDTPGAWFRAGRMIERIYLAATAEGYAVQPITYPTESSAGLAELTRAFGLESRSVPLMLLRVGRAAIPSPSPRRELASVLL